MRIRDFFSPLAALQEWIHHLPDDGAGTNDGDLHHHIVEAHGTQSRKAGHLSAAFYLEHPHGIGLLERGIHLPIVGWKMRKIDFFVVVIANEFDGIFEHGHHAEPEEIDFDDAHVGAIFFIPLHDDAAGHGSRLERNNGIKLSLADDHAARVLAEMARQVLHGEAEFVIFA